MAEANSSQLNEIENLRVERDKISDEFSYTTALFESKNEEHARKRDELTEENAALRFQIQDFHTELQELQESGSNCC